MPLPPVKHPAAEQQTLDDVMEWHGGMVESLVSHRGSVFDAIHTGSQVTPRFTGMSEADVDAHFIAQRLELDG